MIEGSIGPAKCFEIKKAPHVLGKRVEEATQMREHAGPLFNDPDGFSSSS
jgi:hypothetical protein